MYSNEKKVHLISSRDIPSPYKTRTACGREEENDDFVTPEPDEITCWNCKHTDEFRKRKNLFDATEEHNEMISSEEPSAKDKVVGESPYNNYEIQPIQFVLKNEDVLHSTDAFLLNNVLKYICRHRDKGGKEDLEKAIHYLELVKEHTYG